MDIVRVTKAMLKDLYDDFHDEEDLPAWDDLTPEQQSAALTAVEKAHGDIDEFHSMADAIQELQA